MSEKTYEIFASADGNGLWDLSPCAVSFGHNGTLLIRAEQNGRMMLYHLELRDCDRLRPEALRLVDPWGFGSITHATPARVDPSRMFDPPHLDPRPVRPDSRILITHSSLVESPTWHIFDLAAPIGYQPILSASRAADLDLSKAQVDVVWFDSTGNRKIQAWVIRPSKFDPQQRYPLAYFIHGGPRSVWNNQWDVQSNLALFAEHGFVVVAPNPAGSSGFGQAFRDSSRCSWGGLPYTDLARGFEYLQQNESLQYIDTTRAVAVGAGYGGYMVNWIQGHEFGRKFKALVTHDGIFSMTSQLAGNRQHFINEFGGPIWETPDEWRKWDPARFTANWQTPHLVIHCELNYKRVIADGLAAFNVLQLRGVDSAFLVFPDEGDPIVNPENNLLWYRTVIDWMRKYSAHTGTDTRSNWALEQ
ncbi:hypothetical protein CDV55_103859 [Aspergillus turcosus]|nr:hypothetical protein CDV55_103859 [Aspergillus turcosus]